MPCDGSCSAEEDQVGSAAPSGDHATINSLYAEAWSFLGRNGVDARWTLDEHERLIEAGWGEERAKAVAGLVFDFQNAEVMSKAQIDSYTKAFGIDVTRDNVARMARTICSARAAACHEATKRLPAGDDDMAEWIDDAVADDAPFAFEEIVRPSALQAVVDAEPLEPVASRHAEAEQPAPSPLPQRPKKSLLEAGEDCIVARLEKEAWNSVSVNQVRTALRLFDHAAGGNVFIEDLKQCHVREFTQLCGKLPNRWGRTRDERTGGIAASLARAAKMAASDVGIGQETINKHLTWVDAVLTHAAGDENDDQGHRPATPLLFENARVGVGKKARKKRKRDKRASWTKQEVAKLLSARVWTSAASINDRLTPGSEIIHDA